MIILACGMMCFSASFSASASDVDSSGGDEVTTGVVLDAETLAMIQEQEAAVDAYDCIVDGMRVSLPSDPEYPDYPDEYGGAYYKDGYLYICLTDTSSETEEKYLDYSQNPEVVKFEQVEYSYNELYELQMNIADIENIDVSSIGVNQMENTVEVGVPEEKMDSQQEVVEQGIASALYSMDGETRSYPITYVVEESASPSSTSLVGGTKIKFGGKSGTMTISGTYGGSTAILTAGHCVTVGTTYKNSSGTTIGKGTLKQYSDKKYYDYGVIKITNSNFVASNYVKSGDGTTTTITKKLASNSGLVGTTVLKYGSSYGLAAAKIKETNCVAIYINDGITLYGMTKAEFTTGSGMKGDSGGPVYANHKLYGIYSGDDSIESTNTGATIFWYSPIFGVPSSFSCKLS